MQKIENMIISAATYARIESGQKLEKVDLDLRDVIKEVCGEMESLYKKRRHEAAEQSR